MKLPANAVQTTYSSVSKVFHRGPCNSRALLIYFIGLSRAGVAQLVEHLICNQRVGGSNPSASSAKDLLNQGMIPVIFREAGFCIAKLAELCLLFSRERSGLPCCDSPVRTGG